MLNGPCGTAAFRRVSSAWLFGPGIDVLSEIIGISIPPNRCFAEVDVHLLRF